MCDLSLLPDACFGGQKVMNRVAIQKNGKADFCSNINDFNGCPYLCAIKPSVAVVYQAVNNYYNKFIFKQA